MMTVVMMIMMMNAQSHGTRITDCTNESEGMRMI